MGENASELKRSGGHRLWNRISFQMVLLFLLFLIPIYSLLLISARSYIRSLEKQACSTAQSILDMRLLELDSEISQVDRYFYNIQQENKDFIRIMNWQGQDMDWVYWNSFNRSLVLQDRMFAFSTGYFLYLEPEDTFLLVDRSAGSARRLAMQEQLSDGWYIRQNIHWNVYEIGGIPYLLHTTRCGAVFLGAVFHLDNVIEEVEEGIPFEKLRLSIGYQQEKPNDSLTVGTEIHGTKRFLYVTLDREEISGAMPLVSRVILIVGSILMLLLPLLLVFVFYRLIVRPIRRIEKGIRLFGEGNPNYRIAPFHTSREFNGLKDSFHTMADQIQTLKIRQYEEQLERERMLLQNLLLQIRPHFLLNFFNQIFAMAELEDFDGIKKSSLYLSKFFRYLFRSERIATLRSELSLVDDYLELMAERFPDCFTVEREIDEELLSYRIPPLIVQNFVENIFKYAVSEGSMIFIRLSLLRDEAYVVMTIEDDGPGMEEETLRMIREAKPIEKADGTHIGIYNSSYRLKKLCGEDCILEVTSVLTEGTTVKIKIPETAQQHA